MISASRAEAQFHTPAKVVPTRVRLHHGRLRTSDLHAFSKRAHPAIVGGSTISIAQAPWQVVLIAVLSETEGLLCGGSILNETEVLTAAHCVLDPETGEQIPPGQIVIGAGTADLNSEQPEEQERVGSGVRVHPYYEPQLETTHATPDDVAVVKLETPLVPSPGVKAIGLVPAGSLFAEGTHVQLTGFGEENAFTEELDGELHSIGMSLGFSRQCGGEAGALLLCASTPTGSDCSGDSGSGLTIPGSPPTLAGVTDTVQVINEQVCLDGAVGGFADVAAPEIRDFILDDALEPPRAPRGGGISVEGFVRVGAALRCNQGSWSNSPTFTYAFLDGDGGQVLQQGPSPTYTLTAADIGRTIECEVFAANAGGTGVARTVTLPPIEPSPSELEEAAGSVQSPQPVPPQPQGGLGVAGFRSEKGAPVPNARLASSTLRMTASGSVVVKVSCPTGVSICDGSVSLRTLKAVLAAHAARQPTAATLVLGTGSFSVPGGRVKTLTLHLSRRARALLTRSHQLRISVTIVAHDHAGATHTSRTTTTLLASKIGHRKG